jgi:hypothetical protein
MAKQPARKTLKNRQRRQALPLRTNPEEIELSLTDSFRNGPHDRRAQADGPSAPSDTPPSTVVAAERLSASTRDRVRPEVLRIEEVEVPPPGKGEVQIRIKALGLNRAESMFRQGQYLEEPKLPSRLGYEAAGTIAAVGPGVQGFKVGDVVSTIPSFSLNDYGLYGDLSNAPVHAVTHHPASLSWEEAAAIWMQYLTAYGALIDIGKLTKGDTILIPAASSSVGLQIHAIIPPGRSLGTHTPCLRGRTIAERKSRIAA